MSPDTIAAIETMLNHASRVLVVTHVSPDGDAIGSLTAMGLALKQLGKEAALVCDDGYPRRFSYLPLSEAIHNRVDANEQFDLLVALDCGDMSRMGRAYSDLPEPKPPIVNVDHHVTNTFFGDVNLVEPECNSTAEILYKLLPRIDVTITAELATSLLTGIVTDTLGFRTVGVTGDTFEAAGDLMEAGADLAMITTEALLLKPLTTLQLWRIGLDNMRLEEEGVLWTSISEEERKAIGYEGSSSGGLVNMMANVAEATMSAVLIEADNQVYVGFRCRPPYSVSELARNLGGGGHPLASGCTLEGPLAKAEDLVVAMSKESIRQQRAVLEEEGH